MPASRHENNILSARVTGAAILTVVCSVVFPMDRLLAEGAKTLTLRSAAFSDIPAKYTCAADNIAPPFEWDGVPENTSSLVLIVDDPDAPDPMAPRMTWVHWVLYNIPPEAAGLTEGATSEDLPPGTEQGLNDWKQAAYGGPCPPIGRHRYFHKLYALDTVLKVKDRPTKAEIEAAMKGHVIEQAELVGTYEKSR